MRRHLPGAFRALIALFTVVPLADAGAPAKKPLAVDDLYRMEAAHAPALMPSGKSLVYVRTWIDAKTKLERNALWTVAGPGAPCRPMERDEPDARAPVVSPDGRYVTFLSTRRHPDGWKPTPPVPPESDAATDLWLIATSGGPAIPLGGPDRPFGRVFHDPFYGRVAFSPDGTRVVFVADDGADPRAPAEIENQVEIVRPDQGEGYTGYGPAQVWLADLDPRPGKFAARRITRLTHDDVWYGDPQWLPDGKSLVVVANKSADRESVRFSINKNFDLWAIDLATQKQRQLTTGPGPEFSPRVAPDGKSIVCLSVPRRGTHYDVFNLAVVTLADGGTRTRVLFDHHGPGADKPPHLPPMFPLPDDGWDGSQSFTCRGERHMQTALVTLALPAGTVAAPAANGAGFADRESARRKLLPRTDAFLDERLLAPSQVLSWASEGHTIEALLTLPPASVAKPPYKLILHPHGGPHSRAVPGFNFTVQLFAAHGYAVLQPNFRGSTGYGQKFVDADRGDFGGGDMRDCLAGIDKLVRDGIVDKDRQFVYGTSYGGFMTTWLVGQTNQFRAAVAQNAVTDLNLMWSLSDLQSWTQWEFGGLPWEVPGAYRAHSPLAHAVKVRTPTLILHSRADRRCPLPMGQAFYQALRARGVPTQMAIYPHEGHGIRQPRHREDVLRRVLAWFEKYDR